MYIIRRTDQGGGYVAPAGSKKAYTRNKHVARVFRTSEAADADRCVDNEVVEQLYDFLHVVVA